MRPLFPALLALVAGALTSCVETPDPKTAAAEARSRAALADAITRMCDVDRHAGLKADADLLALGLKRSAWINEHVDNPDAIELRTRMSVKGAADQACLLRDKANEVGVTSCALADALATSGEGGLAP